MELKEQLPSEFSLLDHLNEHDNKMLKVIPITLELINKSNKNSFTLESITDFSDQLTFELFSLAETDGIFSFESDGMKDLLLELEPKKFEDLIALEALYQSDPYRASARIYNFIDGTKEHTCCEILETGTPDEVKEILSETDGVFLYEEQFREIVHLIGGFTLEEAELLRSTMLEKKILVMAQKKIQFISNAIERGFKGHTCWDLFNSLFDNVSHLCNRSNIFAKTEMAYKIGYLKAHYPLEFMAGLLTLNKGNFKKLDFYFKKCRAMKIEIKPVDIQRSDAHFKVEDGAIRFGLGAINKLGKVAIEAIMEAKSDHQISSFEEFFEFVNLNRICIKEIEQLAKSGAFDYCGYTRKSMFEAINDMFLWGNRVQGEANEEASGEVSNIDCPVKFDSTNWDRAKQLFFEQEVIGYLNSSHPLESYTELLSRHATCDLSGIQELEDDSEVVIGGIIRSIRLVPTKNGKPMAFVILEDLSDEVDIAFFPVKYEIFKEHLVEGTPVIIKGTLDRETDSRFTRIIAKHLSLFSEWEKF